MRRSSLTTIQRPGISTDAAIPLSSGLQPRNQGRRAVPRELFGPPHGHDVFGLPRVRFEICYLGFDDCELNNVVLLLLLLCRCEVLDRERGDRTFPRTDRLVWPVETLPELIVSVLYDSTYLAWLCCLAHRLCLSQAAPCLRVRRIKFSRLCPGGC